MINDFMEQFERESMNSIETMNTRVPKSVLVSFSQLIKKD